MPTPYVKVSHAIRACEECGESFQPPTVRSRHCSPLCRYRAREKERGFPCSTCGKQMYRSRERADVPRCLDCRRAEPSYTPPGPKPAESWACAVCGVECQRPATRGHRPKLCRDCRRTDWISASRRRAIYERDGWMCWLCEEPVDPSLIGSRDQWRPSLDHVIPRAFGGDSSEENLRLAHVWCNAVRSDGRHSPEVFRVGA